MLINTFSMQCNITITLESHSVIKIIDKPGILWLYHWYSVLVLVFNFH
jgi:hypothetical protein